MRQASPTAIRWRLVVLVLLAVVPGMVLLALGYAIAFAVVETIALAVAWLIGNAVVVGPIRRSVEREQEAAGALRELDEMKNAFLAATSHDLRGPLAALRGFGEILVQSGERLSPEQRTEISGRIVVNARRMERLLSSLLDLERLRKGDVEPTRETVSVEGVVRTAVADIDLGRRTLDIEVPELRAHVDPIQCERIVENLVQNAVRHTPPGTPIWVSARRDGEDLLIAIDDAGAGVPDAEKAGIFDAFHRGQASGLRPGMGIGLHLVVRFAELHGGRAWVEDRPGGGASFRAVLARAFADDAG